MGQTDGPDDKKGGEIVTQPEASDNQLAVVTGHLQQQVVAKTDLRKRRRELVRKQDDLISEAPEGAASFNNLEEWRGSWSRYSSKIRVFKKPAAPSARIKKLAGEFGTSTIQTVLESDTLSEHIPASLQKELQTVIEFKEERGKFEKQEDEEATKKKEQPYVDYYKKYEKIRADIAAVDQELVDTDETIKDHRSSIDTLREIASLGREVKRKKPKRRKVTEDYEEDYDEEDDDE